MAKFYIIVCPQGSTEKLSPFFMSKNRIGGKTAWLKMSQTNGKQKEYEDRTKAKKKAEMDTKKNALRSEDISKGVFVPVSHLQKVEPMKVTLPTAANQ